MHALRGGYDGVLTGRAATAAGPISTASTPRWMRQPRLLPITGTIGVFRLLKKSLIRQSCCKMRTPLPALRLYVQATHTNFWLWWNGGESHVRPHETSPATRARQLPQPGMQEMLRGSGAFLSRASRDNSLDLRRPWVRPKPIHLLVCTTQL